MIIVDSFYSELSLIGQLFLIFMQMEFQFKHFALNHSLSTMKVGTDAVLLSALAPRNRNGKILDIGTGCGVVAMLMAQFNPEARITAIDIDRPSIQQAEENFSQSPYRDRMQAVHTTFQDFASESVNYKAYDMVISNPPYFVNSLNAPQKRRNLARHNNMLPFSELIDGILKIITPSAYVTIILPPMQSEEVCRFFLAKGMHLVQQSIILPKPDKAIERIINTYSPIETPLRTNEIIIRQSDDTYTPRYKNLVADILL